MTNDNLSGGTTAAADVTAALLTHNFQSQSTPLTKPLPDTQIYRVMQSGHVNRKGHALVAHLESIDGGATWGIVRECCS